MKTFFFFLLGILIYNQTEATDLYDQLCEFNPNWEQYESLLENAPATEIKSEAHYVQIHLSQVLPILETQSAACPNYLLETRKENITVLNNYKNRGLFPINYNRDERIPVFVDEHKTHCAVGYLMHYSGYGNLALTISKNNNYAWVKELNLPEVKAWQELSGFTLEELKLIQGAYDSYIFDALYLPNKHEVPQKPEVLTMLFDNGKDIWLSGEGDKKVLHGAWVQNYAPGISWIKGFYNKGKRTGRWEEYYPGTDILQRTEHWRNDELNGVRTRYDRDGKIVEELLFANGEVKTKTNFDFQGDLKWIRTPLDSVYMNTKVYTIEGGLLAEGKESVYNPGNLEWFQNIELTALNMASITARDDSPHTARSIRRPRIFGNTNNAPETTNFFNTKPLVQYHKEGEWTYYSESDYNTILVKSMWGLLEANYKHLAGEMNLDLLEDAEISSGYDFIKATYEKNDIQEFKGYTDDQVEHYALEYYEEPAYYIGEVHSLELFGANPNQESTYRSPFRVKTAGKINSEGQRIGKWYVYLQNGVLSKIEEFILPEKIQIPTGNEVTENNRMK